MQLFQYAICTCLVTICMGIFWSQNEPNTPQPNYSYSLNLQLVAEGLSSPVYATAPKDGSGRLFICEQSGTIRIVENEKLVEKPFLDISNKLDNLNFAYTEKGLIGHAFHPNYKTNGRFFVHYSAPPIDNKSNHTSVISEFHVSKNPNEALPKEKIILTVNQPESNHNGGPLVFGPDGYLYISLGDGGGAGDKHGSIGNGQDLNTLLGKILRIDIDRGNPYSIPKDNPFLDRAGRDEIFAYGLRNVWGMSFDPLSGYLFAADVGQNKYEELNLIVKGGNYGWRIMEGYHCYNPSSNCNDKGLKYPINEYSHKTGISIAGGYRYRSSEFPSLFGLYIFGDWSGKLFGLHINSSGRWERHELKIKNAKEESIKGYLNAFGQDESGGIYILSQRMTGPRVKSGKLHKILP